MSLYNKKLYIKKSDGVIQTANLYTDKADVGSNYIVIKDNGNTVYVHTIVNGDVGCNVLLPNGTIQKINNNNLKQTDEAFVFRSHNTNGKKYISYIFPNGGTFLLDRRYNYATFHLRYNNDSHQIVTIKSERFDSRRGIITYSINGDTITISLRKPTGTEVDIIVSVKLYEHQMTEGYFNFS